MSRVEDVLAAHADWFSNRKSALDARWLCTCMETVDEDPSGIDIMARHRAHVAAALAEAGIGDLAEERERIALAIEDLPCPGNPPSPLALYAFETGKERAARIARTP